MTSPPARFFAPVKTGGLDMVGVAEGVDAVEMGEGQGLKGSRYGLR
jgi:hypothetical protein